MSLVLVTPPAVEPVRLADLKARLQLSGDAHDGRLAQLIRTARERVERETGQVLLAQTWLERRDSWDGDGRLLAFGTQFRLPKPPLMAIESISVLDAAGTTQPWSAEAYFVDTLAEPGRIALRPNEFFPQPGRAVGGIEIRFRCGYGEAPEDVPAPLVEAVLALAAALWEREDSWPLSVQALLAPWRRLSL